MPETATITATAPTTAPCLVADIGGTHARFAVHAQGVLHAVRTLRCADHATLAAALQAYRQEVCQPGFGLPWPHHAALAVAHTPGGDVVRMTNHAWVFSQDALRAAMGWEHLLVLNDFTALALGLPQVPAAQLQQVGGAPHPDGPAWDQIPAGALLGVLGPGTGLGVSGLWRTERGRWQALDSEGGHATWAAVTARERLVFDALMARYGHVSVERVASGPGLAEVYSILGAPLPVSAMPASAALTPAQVTERALNGSDEAATEALQTFCAALGSLAGNLALTLGARHGVLVGGGIVPRLGAWFGRSAFRSAFDSKGRYQPWLAQVPVWVVHAPESPAMRGAAWALQDALVRRSAAGRVGQSAG